MPKCQNTRRDMRALQRSLHRTCEQLRQMTHNAAVIKEKAFAAEKAHKLRQQASDDILKNSLQNFSVPFYKQQTEIRRLKKMLALVRKQNATLVRQLRDTRKIKSRPKVTTPKSTGAGRGWKLLRCMDI